mmetsp:Transcript_11194/g.13997  ORF Transcript_11194/g.13997 Transcript_11194/m.13997 type:complete len:333 (+) Transcript_11194:86-1084(+)
MDVNCSDLFPDVSLGKEILEGSRGYFCAVCCLEFGEFGGVAQVRAHLISKKHRRRLKGRHGGLISLSFDNALLRTGVVRVLSIGDCHGGRCLHLFSGLVRTRFYGGSVFSWANGVRYVPPLTEILGRDLKLLRNSHMEQQNKLVVIFSYGEIDVRCHSSKWKFAIVLARQYVAKVQGYVQEFIETFGNEGIRVFPLLLAVPPASNQGHNPKAPFVGTLSERVTATKELNHALDQACCESESSGNLITVRYTGKETWSFAEVDNNSFISKTSESTICDSYKISGSLNPALSDGHVHVRSELCGPVHECVRRNILKLLSLNSQNNEHKQILKRR